MIWLLVLVPSLAGLVALFVRRSNCVRRALLVGTAVVHAALTGIAFWQPPEARLSGWLALDGLGLSFLVITSGLFLAVAVYAVGFLKREARGERRDVEEGFLFTNAPEATFSGCLLLFLASMTLVTVSQHFGLMWVAVEATTLASAPLIYFRRHPRSLEATWKYLVICSVGIALALLGNFFLVVAAPAGNTAPSLLLSHLLHGAAELNPSWFKAAFIFLLVGYGTKTGLAPLHTWLPDAHSEAPSAVSALLSGALLNCAFLAILRAQQVAAAAGQGAFGQKLLVAFGLLSMAFAAVFVLGQPDFKRMLAYSSVEHMGIVALGVGLGGAAAFGAMLHAVNHSLTKGMLFLVAGNIVGTFRTKAVSEVMGLQRILPVSAVLWIAGFLAIVGSPPFGPFLSEFVVLKAAIDGGHGWVAGVYLALLGLIFVGMATAVLPMIHGEPGVGNWEAAQSEPLVMVLPPAVLGALVLMLGLYVPPAMQVVLRQAAHALGGF